MSANVSQLRETPLGTKATQFSPDSEIADIVEEDDIGLKERVAVTTKAAWDFTSKAPRWARRQASKAKNTTGDVSETLASKAGKTWTKLRRAVAKLDFAALAWTFGALLVWLAWNIIVWTLIMFWISLAFGVNPIFGWCLGVVLMAWGISFTAAFTTNTAVFLTNNVY